VDGGQKVKTFNIGSGDIEDMTIESLIARLKEHFCFAELIADRKISMNSLTGSGYLAVVGTDGSRHVPIRTDDQLKTFFKTVTNSKLPSVEVKLLQPGAPHMSASRDAPNSARRAPGDRVVELEDQNFKMSKATQKVQTGLEDLKRNQAADREEAQRLVGVVGRDLGGKVDETQQVFGKESQNIKEANERMSAEMDLIRKALKDVEKSNTERGDKVQQQLDEFNSSMQRKFEHVQTELGNLRQANAGSGASHESEGKEIKKLAEDIQRLEKSKVPMADWKSADEAMSLRIKEELASVRNKIESTDTDLKTRMEKQKNEIESTSKTLTTDCKSTIDRLNAMMKQMEETVQRDCTKIVNNLDQTRQELQTMVKAEVTGVSAATEKHFEEMQTAAKKNEKNVNEAVSTLSARTEATFAAVELRMENLVKAERSRLGNIEKDLAESTARLRSDCRSEVERVRVDYEQEAARLDADLSDLHMKNDVVKQEINFFQSRLLEQRDWAQRQLADSATATRAAQVDAQEGVSACTRMAHALRDDQVSFRDKMAKHVSLLQHASDSYGDAVNTLETQRSRMRLELDAILGDHKAYVTDMDGWADDVRQKVERLFRAMEPPRCEWRIGGATTKLKELKKPLSLRSPAFGLQGLREVYMELYPNGTNQTADNKAVLRLCLPPGANVRYQCWLGRLTEGSREYESGGSLSVDLSFDSWKDQVLEDGGLNITMEVLQDLTNNDESLARAVHLET